MSEVESPIDVAALSLSWTQAWSDCPPAAFLLRQRFHDRRLRFDTLPNSKRYPTTEPEYAEILRRHHALIVAMAGEVVHHEALIAVTCAWSDTAVANLRDEAVAATMPKARHWRSDDLAQEPGFTSWQHHFVSPTSLDDPALDQLLRCVINDMTDEVTIFDHTCAWVLHPYDGGAEVFARKADVRQRLAESCTDWLHRHEPER